MTVMPCGNCGEYIEDNAFGTECKKCGWKVGDGIIVATFAAFPPVIHVEQCAEWTYCQKEASKAERTDNYEEATCPACLQSLIKSAYHFIDEEVRRPIGVFLAEIGDEREFAAEPEIEALARIALKQPEEWKADREKRLQSLTERTA